LDKNENFWPNYILSGHSIFVRKPVWTKCHCLDIFQKSMQTSNCCVCKNLILITSTLRSCGQCNNHHHSTCGDPKYPSTKVSEKIGWCDNCKQIQLSKIKQKESKLTTPTTLKSGIEQVVTNFTSPPASFSLKNETTKHSENVKINLLTRTAYCFELPFPGSESLTFLDKFIGNKSELDTEIDHKKGLTRTSSLMFEFSNVMQNSSNFRNKYAVEHNWDQNFIVPIHGELPEFTIDPDMLWSPPKEQKVRDLKALVKGAMKMYEDLKIIKSQSGTGWTGNVWAIRNYVKGKARKLFHPAIVMGLLFQQKLDERISSLPEGDMKSGF
jgi:hypothetical protein